MECVGVSFRGDEPERWIVSFTQVTGDLTHGALLRNTLVKWNAEQQKCKWRLWSFLLGACDSPALILTAIRANKRHARQNSYQPSVNQAKGPKTITSSAFVQRKNKESCPTQPVFLCRCEESFICVALQVMILYFHPGVFRCILLRWVRLLGFSIMYGTIILKLYRYGQLRELILCANVEM